MRTITPRTLKTLQVLPNGVCTRISLFVSKMVREIRAFFLSTTKNTAETSQQQAQPTDDWRAHEQGVSARPQAALRKSLIQHGLVEIKKKNRQIFVNRRKLLLKGYNFKESKHDIFGKRPAANAAEKIDARTSDWRRWDVSAFRRSIRLFFFCLFFLRSSKNFRFAFLALNVSSQYFTWKISICSARSNHFAAHLAESSLREELTCGSVIELLHRSCNWLKLTERAARFQRGLRAQARKSELKFAWACNSTRYVTTQAWSLSHASLHSIILIITIHLVTRKLTLLFIQASFWRFSWLTKL